MQTPLNQKTQVSSMEEKKLDNIQTPQDKYSNKNLIYKNSIHGRQVLLMDNKDGLPKSMKNRKKKMQCVSYHKIKRKKSNIDKSIVGCNFEHQFPEKNEITQEVGCSTLEVNKIDYGTHCEHSTNLIELKHRNIFISKSEKSMIIRKVKRINDLHYYTDTESNSNNMLEYSHKYREAKKHYHFLQNMLKR